MWKPKCWQLHSLASASRLFQKIQKSYSAEHMQYLDSMPKKQESEQELLI